MDLRLSKIIKRMRKTKIMLDMIELDKEVFVLAVQQGPEVVCFAQWLLLCWLCSIGGQVSSEQDSGRTHYLQ
jgi:hypothetical protein